MIRPVFTLAPSAVGPGTTVMEIGQLHFSSYDVLAINFLADTHPASGYAQVFIRELGGAVLMAVDDGLLSIAGTIEPNWKEAN